MKKVKFKNWNCVLDKSNYFDNGRTALSLLDEKTGEVVAIATVNMPHLIIPEDEVFIKSYAENEGMTEALQQAGVIGEATGSVTTGHCTVYKHKLLV